jgi:KGK domain
VSNQFQPLADGEVVTVKNTYRVSDLAAEIRSKVAASLAEWSDEHGVDGEALRFGSKGWEKGKVRLHLSIEFCPNDGAAQASTAPGVGSTVPSAPAAPNFSGGGNQMSAVATPPQVATIGSGIPENENVPSPVAAGPVAAAVAATVIMGTVGSATATVLQAPPKIDSTIEAEGETEVALEAEDENFDLGTMSEVTGEIDMHLNDGDVSGYVDFDLSDSLPEVSLDDLVSQAETTRPSIIDEVWNEMSQPNWPGVSRT